MQDQFEENKLNQKRTFVLPHALRVGSGLGLVSFFFIFGISLAMIDCEVPTVGFRNSSIYAVLLIIGILWWMVSCFNNFIFLKALAACCLIHDSILNLQQEMIRLIRQRHFPAAFKCYYNFHKVNSLSSDNIHYKMVIHIHSDSVFRRYQQEMRYTLLISQDYLTFSLQLCTT